jgi:hypothetical protein
VFSVFWKFSLRMTGPEHRNGASIRAGSLRLLIFALSILGASFSIFQKRFARLASVQRVVNA